MVPEVLNQGQRAIAMFVIFKIGPAVRAADQQASPFLPIRKPSPSGRIGASGRSACAIFTMDLVSRDGCRYIQTSILSAESVPFGWEAQALVAAPGSRHFRVESRGATALDACGEDVWDWVSASAGFQASAARRPS